MTESLTNNQKNIILKNIKEINMPLLLNAPLEQDRSKCKYDGLCKRCCGTVRDSVVSSSEDWSIQRGGVHVCLHIRNYIISLSEEELLEYLI